MMPGLSVSPRLASALFEPALLHSQDSSRALVEVRLARRVVAFQDTSWSFV